MQVPFYCPNCRTQFRLPQHEQRPKKIRCGVCYLLTELPTSQSASEQPSAATKKPKVIKQKGSEPTPSLHQISASTVKAKKERLGSKSASLKTNPSRASQQTIMQANKKNKQRHTNESVKNLSSQSQDASSATIIDTAKLLINSNKTKSPPVATLEDKVSTKPGARPKTPLHTKNNPANTSQQPTHTSAPEKELKIISASSWQTLRDPPVMKNKKSKLLPIGTTLLLVWASFGAWYINHHYTSITQHAKARLWLQWWCDKFACTLPPYQHPEDIAVLEKAIEVLPEENKAKLYAIIQNRSKFDQDYANLIFTYTTQEGAPLRKIVIPPEHYLTKNSPGNMPSNKKIFISIDLPTAIAHRGSFTISFE